MAMNIKKLPKTGEGHQSDTGTRSSPKKPPMDNGWHGRSSEPPVAGSSYGAFLDWATEGGLEMHGDAALAIRLWSGTTKIADEGVAELPKPF